MDTVSNQGSLNRKKARRQAFLLLFEKTFRDEELSELIEAAVESRELIDDEFTRRLARGTLEYLPEIDARIAARSIGWKKERISRVALCAMRLCCYELFYESEIPVSVSVNEAVELTKTFGTPDDSAFVNGVLGTIARSDLGEAEISADSGGEAAPAGGEAAEEAPDAEEAPEAPGAPGS